MGLYYLCSKNKGADQLLSYCAADLHVCFCIVTGQLISAFVFTYAKIRFSHVAAQLICAFVFSYMNESQHISLLRKTVI